MCTNFNRKIKKITVTSDSKWHVATFQTKYYLTQIEKFCQEYGVNIEPYEVITLPQHNISTSSNNNNMYILPHTETQNSSTVNHDIQNNSNINHELYHSNQIKMAKITKAMATFGLIDDLTLINRVDLNSDLYTNVDFIIISLKLDIVKLEYNIKKHETMLKDKRELLTRILDKLNKRSCL